jgi:hypothetical protein
VTLWETLVHIWSLILFVSQIDFLPMTTVCGMGGDIRFCGQKQTLILISSRHLFVHFVLPFSRRGLNLEKSTHYLSIYLENKKAKRSAYEKERRSVRFFNRKWKDKMNKQIRLLTLLTIIKDPSLRGLRGNQDRQKFEFWQPQAVKMFAGH